VQPGWIAPNGYLLRMGQQGRNMRVYWSKRRRTTCQTLNENSAQRFDPTQIKTALTDKYFLPPVVHHQSSISTNDADSLLCAKLIYEVLLLNQPSFKVKFSHLPSSRRFHSLSPLVKAQQSRK
jgi:hypothetical protein